MSAAHYVHPVATNEAYLSTHNFALWSDMSLIHRIES